MEPLKKQKRVIKRNLTRLKEQIGFLQSSGILDFENLSKLEAALGDYKKLKVNFENVIDELLMLADENDASYTTWETNLMKEVSEIAEIVFTTEGKIKNFHRMISSEESRNSLLPNTFSDVNRSLVAQATPTQPKLKKITVPEFDGDILKFDSFRRLFENLIHNNDELTNVQKLFYLKNSLTGSAAEIIRDFSLEDRAYAEAWSYILTRYDNPRSVVKTLFRKLVNLKQIKSDTEIRFLLDQIEIICRGLKAAGEDIEPTFSRFIAFFVTSKLDPTSARDFENSITTVKSHPTYEELRKFLQIRSFVAEDCNIDPKPKNSSFKSPADKKSSVNDKKSTLVASNVTSSSTKINCVICTEHHFLNQCPKFKDMKVHERFDIVKANKLCIKCFSPFHKVTDCKRFDCAKCKGKHSTLLHRDSSSEPSQQVHEKEKNCANVENPKPSLLTCNLGKKITILSTAVVKIRLKSSWVYARLLLDNASEPNLISHSFAKRNNLQRRKISGTNLIGITNNTTVIDASVEVTAKSRFSEYELSFEADIVEKIPYSIVSNIETLKIVPNLEYAEMKLPYNEVDILVGVEFYEKVMESEKKLVDGLAIRNTKFGHVISGVYNSSITTDMKFTGLSSIEISKQLERFWLTEEIGTDKEENSDAALAEEIFEKTYSRNKDGQFVVDLLAKPTINNLNGSFNRAINTLKRYERHLSVEKKTAYRDFMTEYESLGHMRRLSKSEVESSPSYYIPHHIISRPISTTTKYRVVFNASAIDSSGLSLNDCLYVGPTIQPELFDSILRFRKYNIAFIADVEKMYRQILIKPDQRKFLRILWRANENENVQHFELNTVTYGTSSAPYLATKCLQMVSTQIEKKNSEAAYAIKHHFYMDDLMTGHDDIDQALQLQNEIHSTLASAHLLLRKYQSNSREFLNKIDPRLVASTNTKLLGAESFVFVLGLMWYPEKDLFSVVINCNELSKIITKRVVLSESSKIFDVLGILSPITVRAKFILQDLWREELEWDDPVSDSLNVKFLNYRKDLMKLTEFSIPRKYSSFSIINSSQLIGFCDASSRAYCAIVYLRTVDEFGNINVKFVCAKTRIAPLKILTIPRLELLAAVLLSKLISKVRMNLNVTNENVFLFSDSTTVLSWLKVPVSKLKLFVGNRIKLINDVTNMFAWNYISTRLNPADIGTRGLSAEKFINNNFWLNGPDELINNFESLINMDFKCNNDESETKKPKLVSLLCPIDISILTRFSSLDKLLNVVCYMYRFYNRLRNLKQNFENCCINVTERKLAFLIIVKLSQSNSFYAEIERLMKKKDVKKNSSLKSLDPFVDKNQLIRVGGRLKNSDLAYEKKHPIILSAKCPFMRLYVKYLHEKYFHCNKGVILAKIVNKFWIVGGCNNLVKLIIQQCVLCCRIKAVLGKQFMGNLPETRTKVSRPFTHVGVDLTGHFTTKCIKHRSTKNYKVYAVFFVCFCTRAVHIELVSDLTAENFIESLQRFISRRGRPSCLYSDNGRNFVGANNLFQNQREKLKTFSTKEEIDWKFIVPRTPHQGGLWESAIKSGKSLLLKATKNTVLTFEELSTVICRVECILNSRPLCYNVKPDSAYEVITPGHFLIGGNLLTSAENLDDINLNLNSRLIKVRMVVDSFWHQWKSTYLNELQRRNKWQTKVPNFKVGDIVIIKEDNLQVLEWPMGKILEVFKDRENIVRNCSIKTSINIVRRNVSRLVKLLSSEESSPQCGE